MASAVHNDVAGFAFEGNSDLAEVPSKLPFANKRLFVDACISTAKIQERTTARGMLAIRLKSQYCYGNM